MCKMELVPVGKITSFPKSLLRMAYNEPKEHNVVVSAMNAPLNFFCYIATDVTISSLNFLDIVDLRALARCTRCREPGHNSCTCKKEN